MNPIFLIYQFFKDDKCFLELLFHSFLPKMVQLNFVLIKNVRPLVWYMHVKANKKKDMKKDNIK